MEVVEVFIILHQPQGDETLVNLDNVLRIWPADKGGTGVAFVVADKNLGAAAIYREKLSEVKQMLRDAGLLLQ